MQWFISTLAWLCFRTFLTYLRPFPLFPKLYPPNQCLLCILVSMTGKMRVIFILGHIFSSFKKIRWDRITGRQREKVSETSGGDRQKLVNMGLGKCSSEMMKVLWKTGTDQSGSRWNEMRNSLEIRACTKFTAFQRSLITTLYESKVPPARTRGERGSWCMNISYFISVLLG